MLSRMSSLVRPFRGGETGPGSRVGGSCGQVRGYNALNRRSRLFAAVQLLSGRSANFFHLNTIYLYKQFTGARLDSRRFCSVALINFSLKLEISHAVWRLG
jgi:hypothetical protein